MKRLSLILLMVFVSVAHGQGPKLGTNEDNVRQMLYAAHPVAALLATVKLDGKPSPLQTMAEAVQLANAGKKAEAIALYRRALTEPGVDTRLTLWIWSGLRELGQKPEPKFALEVLGVVAEVPVKNGYDTLAAYSDGTARYLNVGGSGVFWEVPDAKIKALIQNFINASIPAATSAQPRANLLLPKTGAQVTLLTRSGPYVIAKPPGGVLNAGGALMQELVIRNQSQTPAKK
jgi:hypothetical protein